MGYGSRAILACGLGFAVSFLAACGGSGGLLSGNQASTLTRQLDALNSAVQSGDCGTAADAARTFSNAVSDLPATVSTTLIQNLDQAAQTVSQLAAQDCQNADTSSTPTAASTTTSTTPTTTTTTTTSTSTRPTTTTTTSTTPSTTPTTTTTTSTTPTTTTTTSTSATTTSGSGTTSTAPTGGAGLGGGGSGTGNGNGNGGSQP